jgi:hypothetical protein
VKIFRRNVFTGSLLFLAVAGVANAEIDVVPSTDTIVERIGEARTENRARIRSFDVIRTYQLFGKECQRTKSEVTAAISYKPYGVQSYTIHKASGASLGETIVRKILENEKEVLTNPAATDLSADNYVFRFLRTDSLDGRPCYLLALRPSERTPSYSSAPSGSMHHATLSVRWRRSLSNPPLGGFTMFTSL